MKGIFQKMKKFVVMLLSAVMVCSLAACSKTGEKKASTAENAVSAKEAAVNVADIGTHEEVIIDEDTGEVLNEWVPVAGRNGANLLIFEEMDTDNARSIIECASAADEAGYNVYILLGTKTEENAMSYAFVGETKKEGHATSATDNDVIVIVRVGNDGSITVKEFEGTREDITGNVATENSSDEPTVEETVDDVETSEVTEE